MAKAKKHHATAGNNTAASRWEVAFYQHQPLIYIGFFAAAFALRVAYIFSIDDLPTFISLSMDPAYHHKIAQLVLQGDFAGGDEPFYRSPLYFYILAGIYKLFGTGYLAPRIVGAAMGAISVVLIMHLGCKIFNAKSGVISGVIALLCWMLIYFDGELLTTSFTILMGLVLLCLFVRTLRNPSTRNLIGFGLFFGLTAITRENYFPLIGLVFAFLLVYFYAAYLEQSEKIHPLDPHKKTLRHAVLLPAILFFVAAIAAVSPVTIRNYAVLDDFVPITHYTAVNLYIGNNPYADGRTAIVPYTRGDWYGGIEDVYEITQQAYDRPIKPSDVSVYWTQKTLDYIADDFGHFVGNVITKFFFVFDLFEYSNNKQLYYFRDLSPLLAFPLFAVFSSLLIIPLGIFGMVFAAARRNPLTLPLYVILVGYVIGLCLGFVNTRIRMPIIVILIIFSGYAITHIWQMRHRWKFYLLAAVCLIALLLAVNQRKEGHWERSALAGDFIMGNAYLDAGDINRAEPYFQSSIRLTVSEYSQRSRYALAEIETQRGIAHVENNNYAAARAAFKKSLDYQETYNAHINYGNVVLHMENSPAALTHFLRAITLQPDDPSGYLSVAIYYNDRNEPEQARHYLAQASARATTNPQVLTLIQNLTHTLAE